MRLQPGEAVPELSGETLGHGPWSLIEGAPPGGSFVVFHRGAFCKWGRRYLKELDDRIGDFAIRGVRVVAVSGDDRAATEAMREAMQLIRLPLIHSADVAALAEQWGLYLTRGCPEDGAADLLLEPAQVWVRQDTILGFVALQSTSLLWPDMTSSLRAIDRTAKALAPIG